MESSRQFCLNEYANNFIRHKARQLIGKYGFTRDDYEDLKQELALDLLMRLSKFDPSKASLNTFVARIVDRKIANIIRDRRREKRDWRCEVVSLDEETIDQDECDRRFGRYDRPEAERRDMRLDVSLAVSALPSDLGSLAERLVRQTIAEAARDLGVPRGTLYDTAIARLRKTFQDKGLHEYIFVRRFRPSPGK
jgi:RNA polymerase sigma-70 factor (ECF subfamily)